MSGIAAASVDRRAAMRVHESMGTVERRGVTEAKLNPKTDALMGRAGRWRAEFEALRAIIHDFDLAETLKWGWPCYALEGKNIVLMHGFKDYCALLFFKGALLKDPSGVLVQQTENVQATRQLRFAGLDEIRAAEATIRACVGEAIAVERAGLKVALKKTADFPMPDELRDELGREAAFREAFEALTPGRQKAWRLHFAAAKQSKTRLARIEKAMPRIFDGKGPLD
jgi:uncharacterized protein YdeI (YjbR/CyaY-like superfamily)